MCSFSKWLEMTSNYLKNIINMFLIHILVYITGDTLALVFSFFQHSFLSNVMI